MNSLYTLGTRQTNSLTADLERLRNGDNSASLLGLYIILLSLSFLSTNPSVRTDISLSGCHAPHHRRLRRHDKERDHKGKTGKGSNVLSQPFPILPSSPPFRRVQKFRADYADLKSQFERIKNEVRTFPLHPLFPLLYHVSQRAASQRSELLQGTPSGIHSPSASDARRRFAPSTSSQHSESPFQTSSPLSNSTLREHHALHEHSFIQSTEARLDEFLAQGREVLDNLVDQRNVLKGTQRRLLDAANTLGLSRDVIGWIERRR